MINMSSYMNDKDEDRQDLSQPLTVNSCGFYKLLKMERHENARPGGRKDYQLIYVRKGVVYYRVDDTWAKVKEGNMFIYRPDQPQYYYYLLGDQPEVYWIHFFGSEAEALITNLQFAGRHFYNVGLKSEYFTLFENIIRELQVKRKNYITLANVYLETLLCMMSRTMSEINENSYVLNNRMEEILHLFQQHYNTDLNIHEYAKRANISICWFIRSFRAYTGLTPQQFIIQMRINRAKELLAYSSFNISEIASVVGYDDQFYFSRIFKKMTGMSPSAYQQKYQLHHA